MTNTSNQKPASTELTGGAGFTYEDRVVAYYLSHLLRRERAAGADGIVTSVAVQRQGHGRPMDDVIVGFDDAGIKKSLDLQVKRSITISDADDQFKAIIAAAVKTQEGKSFVKGADASGFVVEHVTDKTIRSLSRLISKAKASPDANDFEDYFASTGTAGEQDSKLRKALQPLIGAGDLDREVSFYRNFVALHLVGLEENGALHTEIVNRLQELIANNVDGQDILLFDRLCRIAREGAAVAAKWTRLSLLAQLRGSVRLRVAPNFRDDVARLNSASLDALNDVSETIDDFHVARDSLQLEVEQKLLQHRVVSIGGFPGCGKSAVLRHFAANASRSGPFLFLKNDRLQGIDWTTFATGLGLRHSQISDLLAEIGASGTPILFIDGVDRIQPNQQHIITDLIRAIESTSDLRHWKVIATSRDQGLEAYRGWFPQSFYSQSGMGTVSVKEFSDDEAELLAKSKPNLHRLLFNSSRNVREIARRPFFASVLAKAFPRDATPQTEIDLINAWWKRAGHDEMLGTTLQRQRALIDLAEQGVRNLGKTISVRKLRAETVEYLNALQADHILRMERGNSVISFTHDIFFEWVFFRLLIDLDDEWTSAVSSAGEPPLLGRVVGLLAQDALTETGRWIGGYARLDGSELRPQWRREWLTAAPFTNVFEDAIDEFTQCVEANDFALCRKLLVWFQAQHTVPNPIVMQRATKVDGLDPVRMADLLGWPSDGVAWGRLIDWLIARQKTLPANLVPQTLEIFSVWQNMFSDFTNGRSESILIACNAWLIELETEIYSEDYSRTPGKWNILSSEAQKDLVSSLQSIILRSVQSYSEFAVALFARATGNKRMLEATFRFFMGFTPIMAAVVPEAVEKLVETRLIQNFPDQKLAQEGSGALLFSSRHSHFNLDDIGIENHEYYFHPPSGLHEPFASLLAKSPSVGLRLITTLTNHAINGWRQIHKIHPSEYGTPIPIVLAFPWGQQKFWGDWHVFCWGLGMSGPNVLQCAYLSLAYWAFKEIEKGHSVSDLIRLILQGSQCYASLGLCLRLAIETFEVSEVTLPILTCQRLWEHDFARLVQEPHKDLDLLGFGFLTQLKGDKAKAKAFLESREYRKRDVRELAMRFAISGDRSLRDLFKKAMEAFPDNLPYTIEEERENLQRTQGLREQAELWSGLGDIKNYRRYETEDDQIAIEYESPKQVPEAMQERSIKAAEFLNHQRALNWAQKSLNENGLIKGITLENAIAFAKKQDSDDLFEELADAGQPAMIQSGVSAIAACLIRFGESNSSDKTWAWHVIGRVLKMRERGDAHGSKIPWHPCFHVISALFHDRKSSMPRLDSSADLMLVASHPNDDVQIMAFQALFRDPDPHVKWVAAHFAFDLAHYIAPRQNQETLRLDDTADRDARAIALRKALNSLNVESPEAFEALPLAWVNAPKQIVQMKSHLTDSLHRYLGQTPPKSKVPEDYWTTPARSFNAHYAARIFKFFPLEEWCQSDVYRPKIQSLLANLSQWTAERLMSAWDDKKTQRGKDTSLVEWSRTLGQMFARALPFFELQWVRSNFVKPFSSDNEMALSVLAKFAESVVTLHIFYADNIPHNVLPILDDFVQRVIDDRAFIPHSYRAGEVNGYDMPDLIKALLFVNIDAKYPSAARFINGDWSEIAIIMPLITKLVNATGWSRYVMQNFLTLCERSEVSYPIDAFIEQASGALTSIEYAKGSWVGTFLPARLAAIIQRLAKANYPVEISRARGLLNLLDALIDLGDRRSAALEQDEVFRRVQGLVT